MQMTQQPTNPFAFYSNMQAPQVDDEKQRQMRVQQIQQQIMGQPAQNAVQGATQFATGIGRGLANYKNQSQPFPAAPGGMEPSMMTGLANFFTGRQNGGLY